MVEPEHVRWIRRPQLRRPHIVAAFTGWNDAADAASNAVKHLVEYMGAAPLAEIEPEEFTDFATVRPHVRLTESSQRQIIWPTVSMWTVSDDNNDSDIILILGPEPALRWKYFVEQILGVARYYNVSSIITLGALLADVPHRQPTHILGTAVDENLIDLHDLQRSRYEGPTGIVGVLNDMAHRAGFDTIALWAAVPAYAPSVPSPKASAALIDRMSEIIGIDAPTSTLETRVVRYEEQIDDLIANDPSLSRYIERLENLIDDDDDDEFDDYDDDDDDVDASMAPVSDELDSAALMEEIEGFLRGQSDD